MAEEVTKAVTSSLVFGADSVSVSVIEVEDAGSFVEHRQPPGCGTD
jgi:hypothetical protein